MPVRKRTKSGRFVKSRKRTTKKRAYKVKSRKRPAFYSPKKGQRRLAPARARRAYTKRRKNPKSMFNTPAFKYAAAAGVGVALGEFVNAQKWANPVNAEGKPMLGPIKCLALLSRLFLLSTLSRVLPIRIMRELLQSACLSTRPSQRSRVLLLLRPAVHQATRRPCIVYRTLAETAHVSQLAHAPRIHSRTHPAHLTTFPLKENRNGF